VTRLPNFVVIGAPRSGTTSLFYWLRQHPDVYLPVRKELHFFSYPTLAAHTEGPGDENVLSNLCSTWDEYCAHYAGCRAELAVGEVSPSYLLHSAARLEIASRLGEVQIIALLRDPVDKAFSQYSLLTRQGLENLDFEAALAAEEERRAAGWGDIWWYAEGAKYAAGIAAYADTFGRENLHVVRFQDLHANPSGTVAEVLRFLELDDKVPIDTTTTHNRAGRARSKRVARLLEGDGFAKRLVKKVVPESLRVPLRLRLNDLKTGAKAELDPATRRALAARLAPDVQRLEELLGRSMGWSVE